MSIQMTAKHIGRVFTVDCDDCGNIVVPNAPNLSSAIDAFERAGGKVRQNSRDEKAYQCFKCRRDR